MFGSKATRLSDLIDKIQWTQIQIHSLPAQKLMHNGITVEFAAKKKEQPDIINNIRVRFGFEVMEKLGWHHGDKLVPLYNPNDQLTFLLAKSDHGIGYKIAREIGNPRAGAVSFRWDGEFPLRRMKAKPVEFEAHQGKLIFAVTSKDMA